MANSYNGEDFENGLLHLSKSVFPTDYSRWEFRHYIANSDLKYDKRYKRKITTMNSVKETIANRPRSYLHALEQIKI